MNILRAKSSTAAPSPMATAAPATVSPAATGPKRPRALITGATGGLGKSFALDCAARGYDLMLTDLDPLALAMLAAGIKRQHAVEVDVAACDLAESSGITGLWDDISARGLDFSLLVNVAGLDYEGEFRTIDAPRLNHIVRLNIESVISMTQQVLSHRQPDACLHIINVSSLAAFNPMPVKAVYAASKRFLLDLSLALDRELAGQHVRVTALCPAGMPTNDACIQGIAAQGWAGRITTVNVGTVAHNCLSGALAGRRVYIPGLLNRAVRLLSGLLPRTAVTGLIYHRWCRA